MSRNISDASLKCPTSSGDNSQKSQSLGLTARFAGGWMGGRDLVGLIRVRYFLKLVSCSLPEA